MSVDDEVAKQALEKKVTDYGIEEYSFKFDTMGIEPGQVFVRYCFLVVDQKWWDETKKTKDKEGKEVLTWANRDNSNLFKHKQSILHSSKDLPSHVTIKVPLVDGKLPLWKDRKLYMLMVSNVMRHCKDISDEDDILTVQMFAKFRGKAVQA